jgi:hypothetical protein
MYTYFYTYMGHSNLFICFEFFTDLHKTSDSWYTLNDLACFEVDFIQV